MLYIWHCEYNLNNYFLNSTDDDDCDADNDCSTCVSSSDSDSSVDTSVEDDNEDGNSLDYNSLPFDVPSQTETEDDFSSELEPEEENVTYGKRYVNLDLLYQNI